MIRKKGSKNEASLATITECLRLHRRSSFVIWKTTEYSIGLLIGLLYFCFLFI